MNREWRPRTLRSRLALWTAVGGTVLLTAYILGIYLFVDRYLPVEYRLRQEIELIRAHLTVLPDGQVNWDGRPIGPPEAWSFEKPWFDLWDEHHQLVIRRWPFAERPQLHPLPAPRAGRDVVSIYDAAPDLRLRTIAVPFPGPSGRPWMLQVVTIHERAVDILAAFRLILAFTLPIVIVILVAGAYALTRYWLRPLDEMAREVDLIGVADLSRRVSVPVRSEEIGRVATVFNATLDRLEDVFVALDRFVADASHELRTPLTALRNVGELGLARSRTIEEYRDIIGSMLEETGRLQLITQRLLELARAEGGAERAQHKSFQLEEEVGACLDEMSVLADAKNQHLTLTGDSLMIETDPVIFRQALQNLLDNAIKFSPDGSAIDVTVAKSASLVSVSVADEGPGINADDRHRISRRFFRADSSRSSSGGFGLGLAITKAYMRLLGGRLDYESRVPRGSIFRLSLPLHGDRMDGS